MNIKLFKLKLIRFTQAFPLILIFILCAVVVADGQVIKPFTQRTSTYTPTQKMYHVKGDYTMVGNTNLTPVVYTPTTNNNDGSMKYIDIDGVDSTVNSSSATLNFSTENGSIPECSKIIFAGLYWTGRISNGSPSPNTFYVTQTIPQPINQNYEIGHNNSINNTDYTVAVSRVGMSNSYGVRYTYTSSGSGPKVLFEFAFSPPYVRYSINNGSTWISPNNQNATIPGSNIREVSFDPVTVYAPNGGIILTVDKLLRDSRGDRTVSSYQSNAKASGNVSGVIQVSYSKLLDKRKIKLKAEGQPYTEFTANASDIYYPATTQDYIYSGYVEVTDYVKANKSGIYSVADIALKEGYGTGAGYFGGWSMIVIFENSKMTWRDITIFDGYAFVDNTNSFELPVSGFYTAQAGNVNFKLGLMAGEGDVDFSGDYFSIINQNNTWVPLNHTGNSTTNFFNSSINTGGNARNPTLQNNTGLDLSMFYIPNANNAVITNNQTSTKFKYGSTLDRYIISVIAMAVDACYPNVEPLISATNINGLPVGSPPLTVLPGQDVEYKLEIRNQGTEAINNTKIIIPMPYSSTYVNGSGVKNVYFTPLPSPNNLYFDPALGATGSLVWDFGTLPKPADVNTLLAELTFHLKVTEDCNILKNASCPPEVSLNGAIISGQGEISGIIIGNQPFIQGYDENGNCQGEPMTDPLQIDINKTDYLTQNCQGTPDQKDFFFCNISANIPVASISGSFPAGTRFYNSFPITGSSIEYTLTNSFPYTTGTNMYYAIPPGGGACHFDFTITVKNIISTPTPNNVAYCLNEVAVPFSAAVSDPEYSLYYFLTSTSTTPLLSITPSTANTGVTTYYVAEGLSNDCISPNKVSFTVSVFDFNANITSQTNVFCNNGNSGSATVSATGGNGNYSYSWNTTPVQTTATANNLAAGSYTITITDNNGCSVPVTKVVTITQPSSALSAEITMQTNVFCNGSNTGTATVTATGGSGSYSYSWNTSPVQTTSTANNLTAGSYTVIVTDNNGCTVPVTAVATITEPVLVLAASINQQTNVFCNGSNTGAATVTATGGSGYYSYSWNTSPVQTTSTANNLTAGSYTVIVTDNNGCTVPISAVATITEPVSVLAASINQQTNVFCNGSNTGAATVTATGGSGSYSYSWNTSPVQTTSTANNLTAGSYTVIVTDNNGCTVPISAVATITEPVSVLAASINQQTNVLCNGSNTGSATVTATGGSGSYSYSWNTSQVQTTSTANNLIAGSYTVTVTDNNGCTVPVSAVATITQPSSILAASINQQTNVFCNGGNTGSATVTATGGSGSYSYLWNTSPIQISATAIGLTVGSYTATVTDNNGCSVPVTKIVTITQPSSALSAGITMQTNVFCNGSNTGTATVTATGGSGGYSYLWNSTPLQIGATAINLSAGSYTVTVTDNNGCAVPVTSVTTITQPVSILSASISQQTDVFCFGCNTGSLTVTANGGSGDYSYSWNTTPVQTTATANNLTAGNYTVTVTDNNGCTIPVTMVATIIEPGSVLSAEISSQTNVFCFGGNTGEATVTATGGSGSYSYSWNTSPVQTTATANNLTAGTYTVTVTDNNGSTISVTAIATIIQPLSGLIADISSQTNVFCNNGSTGNATVTASGGSGSYSYLWNTIPIQIGTTAVNLSAGSFTVTVTDNNGCAVPVSAVATITQPTSSLNANITSKTNVFCNGDNTGSVTVRATGGSGSYSYSWNTTPVQTTATANNLTAGSYTVTVTDNNGCTIPVTCVATITQPESVLAASITSQTNVYCTGGSTGSATVTATGGSGSYSYSWNTIPVQTTAASNNLIAGSYTVTVTDNNGCAIPVSTVSTISEPVSVFAASITLQTNVFCNGGNTGTATVTATGGSGSYSYLWNSTPLQIEATALNLAAGSYTVTVTDNNGCDIPVTTIATISQPESVLGANITSQTNVYCNGESTGSATVTATGGSGSYSYSWNTIPVQTAVTANNLTAGSYTITVKDNNGCTIPVTAMVTITEPISVLAASITSQTNVFCNGGSSGSATVTATGGSGAYSYSWNTTPAQTTATAISLAPGSYTVTVSDNNGCTFPVTKVASIIQPSSALNANISSQTDVFCNGGNTGNATVTAIGGSGSYSYLWNTIPAQITETANNLTAGSYTVTVSDNNGCSVPVTKVANIIQPSSALIASISSQTDVFCYGGNSGSATVLATGGSGSYLYSWNTSPVQTTATAIGLTMGTYIVTVTDTNGCTVPVTKVVTITQPSSVMEASISLQTNVFCNGGNTGSATITASGGSGSYSYSWNTNPAQTTATAIGLSAGSYTVTVTDNNGCTIPVTKVVSITQPSSVMEASITSQTNVFCNGGNTGSATVSASGGSGSYSYSWSTNPAQTTATAIGLLAGSYTITVTDNNGCTVPVIKVATITQPSLVLNASINSQTNVFCNGENTGNATVAAIGGSGNYTYLWNTVPAQIAETAINLSAGSYTVFVTDNNGCTVPASATVTITQPVSALAASLSSQTNVFCYGGNTGTATVTATGGSGAYSYSWNTTPSQTSATAIGLTASNYTVTITDSNGCAVPAIAVATITQPSTALTVTSISHTDLLCFGDSTGSAMVTIIGGSGVYLYSWNTTPIQTSATATGLTAGSYMVTVRDSNGCATPALALTIITEPASILNASVNQQTDVYCYDTNTGIATVTATGGSGNYSYLWNTVPAQIGETAINLSAGNYTVTVKDNNGCSIPVTAELTITQPPSILTATASSPFFNSSNISCNGGNDGTINLTPGGGTMPYEFSWTGPGTFISATQNLNGLSVGLYTVHVTDANGCETSTTITLNEPSTMASTVGSTPADCIKSNGTADLDIIGGTQPYSFLWSSGATQQDLAGVPGGTYTVNAIDANGCIIIDTIKVDEISNLSLSSIVNDVLCFGFSDGSINLNVKGTAPFTYSWSNGSTTEDLASAPAGQYFVIINDAAGCTILDTINISQSPQIVLDITSPVFTGNFNISTFQNNNGIIDLTATGGIPPYTYSWSNNATTEDLSNLPAGDYYVIVTDSAGCSITGNIPLTEPMPLEMPTGFSPNGDGKNDKFVVRGIEVYPNNHITIFNRWGNIVYQSDSYNNQWNGINNKGNPLPAGTYFVILEINNKEIVLKGYVDLRRE